jgi:hypothetical protein
MTRTRVSACIGFALAASAAAPAFAASTHSDLCTSVYTMRGDLLRMWNKSELRDALQYREKGIFLPFADALWKAAAQDYAAAPPRTVADFFHLTEKSFLAAAAAQGPKLEKEGYTPSLVFESARLPGYGRIYTAAELKNSSLRDDTDMQDLLDHVVPNDSGFKISLRFLTNHPLREENLMLGTGLGTGKTSMMAPLSNLVVNWKRRANDFFVYAYGDNAFLTHIACAAPVPQIQAVTVPLPKTRPAGGGMQFVHR